jgi:glycerophosphoryl diester phosphodiesterase
MHPFLDHPGPIPFAHRGGAERYPENTMAAFEAAVALGFGYVETDVHATADGVLLAFHDDELDRVTDRTGVVADLPWADVSQARVAGTERIVLFEELLDAWPDLRINVEPKHDDAVIPLIRAIREHDAADRICVGAFADARLAAVREAFGAAICTSLGPREVLALRIASWGGPVARGAMRSVRRRIAGQCVQVPVRSRRVGLVDSRLLTAAHAVRLPVHVWTVNERDELERLLDLGVDGIMSDRPALLRDVLVARGKWRGRAEWPAAESGTDAPGTA